MLIVGALMIATLWAVAAVLEKQVIKKVPYDLLLVIVSTVFSASCLVYYLFRKRDKPLSASVKNALQIDVHTGIYITLIGVLGFFAAYLLLFKLLALYDAHVVIALSYVTPLITLILAYIFLKEKITLMTGIGVVLVVVGVLAISYNHDHNKKFNYFIT